jgi:nitrogen fixation NifU-like protein
MSSPYRERIIDHYRHPRNQGTLDDPDISGDEENPVCGDIVHLTVRLVDGRVTDARFSGRGCVLSLASASLFTEAIRGRTLDELKEFSDEAVFEMLGFRPGPVRARCALLPLRALESGLEGAED